MELIASTNPKTSDLAAIAKEIEEVANGFDLEALSVAGAARDSYTGKTQRLFLIAKKLAALEAKSPNEKEAVEELREAVETHKQGLVNNKENGPRAPSMIQTEAEREEWYDGSIEQCDWFLALLISPQPSKETG